MLERVAREIARHAAVDGGKTLDTADGFSEAAWSDFVDVARAVLEALREPTADMISAAIKKDPSPAITAQWRAMIDAAISWEP